MLLFGEHEYYMWEGIIGKSYFQVKINEKFEFLGEKINSQV
ncbi:MAG: hypothetical protein WBF38_04495 [Nitrosotalea sp.]